MSHVLEPLEAPPPDPAAANAEAAANPVMEAAERTAAALREMAGNLVSKRSAKALLRERNNLRDELRQLQDKTNAVWLVQRNKLLQQELAEADKGAEEREPFSRAAPLRLDRRRSLLCPRTSQAPAGWGGDSAKQQPTPAQTRAHPVASPPPPSAVRACLQDRLRDYGLKDADLADLVDKHVLKADRAYGASRELLLRRAAAPALRLLGASRRLLAHAGRLGAAHPVARGCRELHDLRAQLAEARATPRSVLGDALSPRAAQRRAPAQPKFMTAEDDRTLPVLRASAAALLSLGSLSLRLFRRRT